MSVDLEPGTDGGVSYLGTASLTGPTLTMRGERFFKIFICLESACENIDYCHKNIIYIFASH